MVEVLKKIRNSEKNGKSAIKNKLLLEFCHRKVAIIITCKGSAF
jgi:hypothetical protein